MPRSLAAVLLFAYVGVALQFERHTDAAGELALGGVTWIALWIACRRLDALLRRRVAALVVIASSGEVLGSIVLGLYAYRRGGIPLFVPPGHGLVYLAGHHLSRSVLTSCRRGGAVLVIAAAAVGWAVFGLLVGPRPDVAGALAMLAFLACLLRGPDPRLFAGMFVVVAALELYGTAMGAWTWVPEWPGLGLPAGNPPSGAVAGYCLFDALALRLASLRSSPAAADRMALRPALPSRVAETRHDCASNDLGGRAWRKQRRDLPSGLAHTSAPR